MDESRWIKYLSRGMERIICITASVRCSTVHIGSLVSFRRSDRGVIVAGSTPLCLVRALVLWSSTDRIFTLITNLDTWMSGYNVDER